MSTKSNHKNAVGDVLFNSSKHYFNVFERRASDWMGEQIGTIRPGEFVTVVELLIDDDNCDVILHNGRCGIAYTQYPEFVKVM